MLQSSSKLAWLAGAGMVLVVGLGIGFALGQDSSPASRDSAVRPGSQSSLSSTTRTPSPAVAAVTPTPSPTQPVRTDCQEVRRDPAGYRSDAERELFLTNCTLTQATPAITASPPPGGVSGLPDTESSYLQRASLVYRQWTPGLNNYLVQLSPESFVDSALRRSVSLGIADVVQKYTDGLRAAGQVPLRFVLVHEQLMAALLAFDAHAKTIDSIQSNVRLNEWVAAFNRLSEAVRVALRAYQQALGI